MENEHEATTESPWRKGSLVGPAKTSRDEGTPGTGFFRTLATPGSVSPDLTPAPWSFNPGLPPGCGVESTILIDSAFRLHLRDKDETVRTLRCAVTGPGNLAGETDAEASPSLFSPAHEATEQDGAWVVESPGHTAVLVIDRTKSGLRFGLAWGKDDAGALAAAARESMGVDLGTWFPEEHAPSAGAEPLEVPAAEPSRLAAGLVRHGATLLTALLALIAVITITGVAISPGTGGRDKGQLADLAERLVSDGRYDEARQIYDDIGDLMGPGNLAFGMGRLSFRQGEYEAAAKHYGTAFEEGVHPEASLLNQALSLYRQGQVDSAIARYEECIDTFGDENTNLVIRATTAIEVLKADGRALSPKNVGH